MNNMPWKTIVVTFQGILVKVYLVDRFVDDPGEMLLKVVKDNIDGIDFDELDEEQVKEEGCYISGGGELDIVMTEPEILTEEV